MNTVTMPGIGDPETWASCADHPHDPRTPESDDDDSTAEAINDVRDFINLAEIYAARGNTEMAKNALTEAMLSLQELVGEKP